MKVLTVLTTVAVLATAVPAVAMQKCPQADGTVISVPDIMGCPKGTIYHNGATAADDAQRRIDAANSGLAQYRLTPEQRVQILNQQTAIYNQAVAVCRAMVNSSMVTGARTFKADAASEQMYGTQEAQYTFEACMARQAGR